MFFDCPASTRNLANGTFVVTAGSQYLKGFDRKDFLTYQLPFELDETKEAPLFSQYLDKVLPDKNLQMILAEFIGYVFVRHNTLKLEKSLILYGSGANGKSVFFDIITALLGPNNCTESNYKACSLRVFVDRLKNLDFVLIRKKKGNVIDIVKKSV